MKKHRSAALHSFHLLLTSAGQQRSSTGPNRILIEISPKALGSGSIMTGLNDRRHFRAKRITNNFYTKW